MNDRERRLLTATRTNDWHSVLQLLETGTSPDAEGPFGPVIFMALLLGHTMVARLLVEAGADLSIVDDKGWTPLHWAAKLGDAELIMTMIDSDGDIVAIDKNGSTAFDVLLEYEHHQAIDAVKRKYPREYRNWSEGRGETA
jgi:uncharacterized protein